MNFVKIGKAGEFDIYYVPSAKTYYGKRIRTGELIEDHDLDELTKRAKNYRNELADYFAQILKQNGLRD